MRLLLISVLILTEIGAEACPRGACVVVGTREAPLETPARRSTLFEQGVARVKLHALPVRPDTLAHSLATHVAPVRPTVAMPWIWQTIRRDVYRRMPHTTSQGVSMVFSPVVVESSLDTVPGLGVEGGF